MKNKIKKIVILILICILIAFILFLSYLYFFNKKNYNTKNNEAIEKANTSLKKEIPVKVIDTKCLSTILVDEELDKKVDELKTYITSTYPNTSIMYYDINSKFTFKYNEEEVYYGASLIKVIEALYIYEKAAVDPSILEEEITYLSNYKVPHSLELEKYTIGDKIKIRDLVKYLITVSDNSAHFMLVDYIGFDNLKEFGNTVGNKYTLIGGDKYGNIDLNGAFSYLIRLNEFFNNNDELGNELKSFYDNNYFNSLELEGTNFLHKYGNYDIFFHDIGILDSKDPYMVVVLTKYGKNNKEKVINDISKQIYDLHTYYINKKIEICNK